MRFTSAFLGFSASSGFLISFPSGCMVATHKNSASESATLTTNEPSWDPLPADYASKSGCEKQEFLWNNRVQRTLYANTNLPPFEKTGGLNIILGAITNKLNTKMDDLSDQAPPGWKKPLHRRGVLAKVNFVADPQSPFTGLFKGAPCGLLRLSLTADPGKDEFNPGLAWKALVDGQTSSNVSALVSLDGQHDDFNFFSNEFSNIVKASKSIKLKIAAEAFRTTSKHPHKISVSAFAKVTDKGAQVDRPHAPVRIFFTPDQALRNMFSDKTPRDFREYVMRGISIGMPLFHLYAVNDPTPERVTAEEVDSTIEDEALRNRAVKIGTLVNTSTFAASQWGDDGIFFRHERFRSE